MEQVTISVSLPESISFSNRDKGLLGKLGLAELNADIIGKAVVFGLTTSVMNAYNSGGDKHPDKLAAMEKRINALLRGDWAQASRGETHYTVWRDEVFVPMCLEAGMTIKAANDAIKAKVKEAFGPDESATFSRYLDATANDEHKAGNFETAGAARDALEAFYDAELTKRREATAKAASKVVVPSLDLSAFKKAK